MGINRMTEGQKAMIEEIFAPGVTSCSNGHEGKEKGGADLGMKGVDNLRFTRMYERASDSPC